MKHVMYAEKSVLMDDASADTLIDYAAALADVGGGDTVSLHAVGVDGNEVDVTFLLNAATVLVVESASADLDVTENTAAVEEMRRRTAQLRNPIPASPEARRDLSESDFDYDFDPIR